VFLAHRLVILLSVIFSVKYLIPHNHMALCVKFVMKSEQCDTDNYRVM